ncbi:transmembrane protein 120 homolog [Coccinella septempunctata]|uniref:transmembrane protein 120 homolog n=1 Tax=Coccinella septempunctata TaxID=41139 RepID=UPI001D06D45D|nr:transmembrane protein 120 homolog [Coccinella septempunctata]
MVQDLLEEWNELSTEFKDLEAVNKIYTDKLEELGSFQNNVLKQLTHQKYRLDQISKTLKDLKKKGGAKEQTEQLENDILKRKIQLQGIEQTLPKKNGIYLRIILGNVNVSILNKEEKFKYKDEYEKFKLVLSIICFIFSLLNLIIIYRPLELCHLFLLVWYYCTLTIRESILKVNGSRIKGWWRLHHFVSTVAAAILLIWPENKAWGLFRYQFLIFNGYISTVQYLQFRYQQGVLYRLKALGERHNMDITVEGFHSWMWRGLGFLFPFLFIGYFFQLYNAYTLYQLSFLPSTTWHVPVLSAFFLFLFIGNTVTTIMVIPNKIQEKMKLQYNIMSQRLSSQFLINDDTESDSTKQD